MIPFGYLAPVSEVLARILVEISKTVSGANDVLVEQESFSKLARYLEKIQPLLMELQEKNLQDAPPLKRSLDALETEIRKSQKLAADCSSKSRFYLLINCRTIVKEVQEITHEIGRCLSLIPLAGMNLSAENAKNTKLLFKDMQNAHFKAAMAGEEVVDMIESGMRTHRLDNNFSNELLLQIANAVKVPVDPASLQEELVRFKREKEEIELHKDQAEAYQLQQIIGMLSRADAATTASEKEIVYRRKKNAGGNEPLPALQSFICPITQEVMEDPVEITTGQTFERHAIVRWFSAGNRSCPTTKLELECLDVKPNLALRQSIEEWKERNTIISISATRPKLLSENQDEIQKALLELYKLSEEKPLYRYWISSERLIPEIVKLLKFNSRDVRRRALSALCSLSKNDENKEEIAAESAIPIIARSLARDVGESRQAVALLLELSKMPKLLDMIGSSQGCILLLVMMLRSEDASATEDARQLLMNLSGSDTSVVQMAEANHFVPLISRLGEGSDETKMIMASALTTMSLTEDSKVALGKDGAIEPLVKMLVCGKQDHQNAALGALQSLSMVYGNREAMIAADVLSPLLQLLFSLSPAMDCSKELAAATLANLASWDNTAAEAQVVSKFSVLLNDENVSQMITLVKVTGSSVVQVHLLRGLAAMCSKASSASIRLRLKKQEAAQVLLELFLESAETEVRTNSLKLLVWISRDDGGKELASQMSFSCINALVKFISSSVDDDASSAAVGVIGNLPANHEVVKLLQQAEALPTIAKLLAGALHRISTKDAFNTLVENAAAALLLFSNPSSVEIQTQAAAAGVISSWVKLLGTGTALTKFRAATALGQFSENSGKLSTAITRRSSSCCFCFFFFNSRPDLGCIVHGGKCSVKSSFCLVEAEAIGALVQTLADADGLVQEAALGALTTLLYDETWENGVHVIANAQGVRPVVRLMTTGSTGAKEKAVWMLEKIFRFEKYKEEYGGAAQMPLIDLTQKGGPSTRQLAAKILAHLNILHNQSSYF